MRSFVPEVLPTRLQERKKKKKNKNIATDSYAPYWNKHFSSRWLGYVQLTLEQHLNHWFHRPDIYSYDKKPLQWEDPSVNLVLVNLVDIWWPFSAFNLILGREGKSFFLFCFFVPLTEYFIPNLRCLVYIFSAVKIAPLLFNNNNLVNQGFFKPFFTFIKIKNKRSLLYFKWLFYTHRRLIKLFQEFANTI